MKIILSKHAKQRLIEREIKMNDITSTVDLPDYTITKEHKTEAYKKIDNKILRVIYAKGDTFIKIITVIWK